MENDQLFGTEFYWCVNCGHYGKFPFRRSVRLNCELCNYDALTPYELDEILEDDHLKHRFEEVIK